MSCTIDHSKQDVINKLESQKTHLPQSIYSGSEKLLNSNPNQKTLNELFHLLKKYDLADKEEQLKRNQAFEAMFAADIG
ncbi:hypothetical protein P6709_12385 [Jeotgalibacillus sp. ET6]|uniref:hypothetical protein n=1 Tax=Jeotgalibacillus sp. ET6 TaxID=3037260 RepID=UPI002418ACD5|nr:hypothetical protein [Jeotgalibacillus sp. ET6]MDG5472545.1 hypothetical protein [Jeotgalibacillus sp. ET6]